MTVLRALVGWPSRGLGLDGVYTGADGGELVELFDPPWWRLDRWLEWLTTGRPRVELRFERAGEVLRVRAISANHVPPSPRRRYVELRRKRR